MKKSWQKPIEFIYKRVPDPLSRFSLYIKQKMGWLGTPKILPYIGFGNQDVIYIRGRVVEDKELSRVDKNSKIWDNILAMLRRYISDEIPFAKVKAEFNGQAHMTETNEYGEFEFSFTLLKPLPENQIWHNVKICLADEALCETDCDIAYAQVMVDIPESQYGIISDIDDTILVSHSTSLLKKMRLMLLKNAASRLPFEGVAAFYRALHLGQDNKSINPLFYVSSSEWNLYDLLIDFCDHQSIPRGTFMLHDLKVGLLKLFKSGQGKHDHKLDKIRHILSTYKKLKFILIGDSGQKDPEIYLKIIKEFPGRIQAVYIRDVSKKSRQTAVKKIALEALTDHQVEMLLVKDTEAAALHAIDSNYITSETLVDIARERYKDQYSESNLIDVLTSSEKG